MSPPDNKSLICLSIAANALSAGGIFTFPLMAPALAAHLKLSQPQLTTIVLAGIAGQYPVAGLAGRVVDWYGPRRCSLISAVLFPLAFSLFSWEISKTPDDVTLPSQSSFYLITVFYMIAGVATAFAYFAMLFAASRNFPEYLGVASGTTTALFGLSPLVLSLLASHFFMDSANNLDISRYLIFLAILAGSTHLIGAFWLTIPPLEDNPVTPSTDENTTLLPKPVNTFDKHNSAHYLVRDPYFWLLFFWAAITLGSSEMVISNIGSIALSLPKPNQAIDYTATQVRLLSLSSTISRLLIGPFADFVSPAGGTNQALRKHRISRMAFACVSSSVLFVACLWMAIGVRTQYDLWILSVGIGAAYGTAFTVLPSIMSSIWGSKNLGTHFGIIMYCPCIGTPFFSYLYAFVSEHHAQREVVCRGRSCWQVTFFISSACSVCGLLTTLILWRKWKGRL